MWRSSGRKLKGSVVWSMDVFDDNYLHFDPIWPDRARAEAEAGLIAGVLRLEPGARVLDLACGTGRIAHALSRMEMAVVGVDDNPAYLEIARISTDENARHPPRFWPGDMRRLDFEGVFDAAIVWSGSFGFFSEAENAQVVRGMARAVRSGGAVLVEQPSRWSLARGWQATGVRWLGQDILAEERVFDPVSERTRVRRTTVRDGVVRTSHFEMRLYGWPEARALLEGAGLSPEAPLDERGDHFGEASARLISVGRKPASAGPQL